MGTGVVCQQRCARERGEMGVRDTAEDVVDRGAGSPAEAFANLVLSPQPCPRSRPRPRPSSASAAATPPPSVSTYTTDTADEERAAWTVHRALTSVASPCKHAPTPIASPLSLSFAFAIRPGLPGSHPPQTALWPPRAGPSPQIQHPRQPLPQLLRRPRRRARPSALLAARDVPSSRHGLGNTSD